MLFYLFLWKYLSNCAIAHNRLVTYRIPLALADILAVALDRVDNAIFTSFNNAGVFRYAVVIPIEENNHARLRLYSAAIPFPLFNEPPNPIIAEGFLFPAFPLDRHTS